MTVAELVAAMDELVVLAQKFSTSEPAFVAKLTSVVDEVKAAIPAGTLSGLVKGVEADYAKVKALFQKKK